MCAFRAGLVCVFSIGFLSLLAMSQACRADEPPAGATATQAASSDMPPGVSLLAEKSPAKWQPALTTANGWRLVDGKLSGAADSKPLNSGLELTDFELHVVWHVSSNTAIRIGLPAAAGGQGIEVRLAEQPGVTLRLPQGARILRVAEDHLGKAHVTILRRAANNFAATVDGIASRDFPLPAAERLGLTLSIEGGPVTIDSLRLVQTGDLKAADPNAEPHPAATARAK